MPGRLTRHRHPGPTLGPCPVRGPVQGGPQIPRPATERLTRQHFRVVIGDHHHLLAISQINPHERVAHRHQRAQPSQSSVAVAITPRHPTTVAHERPPSAWDTKPEAHQEDVPTPGTDTQNVFLCRTDTIAPTGNDEGATVRFAIKTLPEHT